MTNIINKTYYDMKIREPNYVRLAIAREFTTDPTPQEGKLFDL